MTIPTQKFEFNPHSISSLWVSSVDIVAEIFVKFRYTNWNIMNQQLAGLIDWLIDSDWDNANWYWHYSGVSRHVRLLVSRILHLVCNEERGSPRPWTLQSSRSWLHADALILALPTRFQRFCSSDSKIGPNSLSPQEKGLPPPPLMNHVEDHYYSLIQCRCNCNHILDWFQRVLIPIMVRFSDCPVLLN